jgi:hypothetical protein
MSHAMVSSRSADIVERGSWNNPATGARSHRMGVVRPAGIGERNIGDGDTDG